MCSFAFSKMKLFNKIARMFHKQKASIELDSSVASNMCDEKRPQEAPKWEHIGYKKRSDSENAFVSSVYNKTLNGFSYNADNMRAIVRGRVLEGNESTEDQRSRGIDQLLKSDANLSNQIIDGRSIIDLSKSSNNNSLFKIIYKKIVKQEQTSSFPNRFQIKSKEKQITDPFREYENIEIAKNPERFSSSTGTSNPFDDCFRITESNTTLASNDEMLSFVSEQEANNIRAINVQNFKTLCTDNSIRTWENTGHLPTID